MRVLSTFLNFFETKKNKTGNTFLKLPVVIKFKDLIFINMFYDQILDF